MFVATPDKMIVAAHPSFVADGIREWFDSFGVGIPTWRVASQDG
ncbi:protein of unknown function (plasmid) [Cupriavidus taiwanensis]|nr:protein of unknown function [Cupriavidus taiwanensis]